MSILVDIFAFMFKRIMYEILVYIYSFVISIPSLVRQLFSITYEDIIQYFQSIWPLLIIVPILVIIFLVIDSQMEDDIPKTTARDVLSFTGSFVIQSIKHRSFISGFGYSVLNLASVRELKRGPKKPFGYDIVSKLVSKIFY
jgi:hypothetical protein